MGDCTDSALAPPKGLRPTGNVERHHFCFKCRAAISEHDGMTIFHREPYFSEEGHREDRYELCEECADQIISILDIFCPQCGGAGGGGFDRTGSHTAGELVEYPCPRCGKE